MRKLIFVVLVGMAFSPLIAKGDLSEGAPEGEVYSYKKEGGVAHEIEIHFPKDHELSKPVPGIIMFHGGGWSKGDRISFRYLCHYFASRGLVAATANYRLGKGKRLCITDAKSAIRWYKQNATKLGVDPKRIVAGGGSAGGSRLRAYWHSMYLFLPFNLIVIDAPTFKPFSFIHDKSNGELKFCKK